MKNVRFEINIKSEPSSLVQINTEIRDTLFPEFNYQLNPNDIIPEVKKRMKEAPRMITITVLEYEQNCYQWGSDNIKASVRFILRNYNGIEWEKRYWDGSRYPEREQSYTGKDIYTSIVELCKLANDLHINNIRNK